ncbi:MAG TPA: isoprenylcysteine carboxylmethyltransferase family protein [Bauldia sp.]|nr:isoprenylcysteine carboxylmethyltransferase family protein [Bauldia sp.]
MIYGYVIAALWLAWAAYWFISAAGVKPVVQSESWQSRVAYSAPLWVAVVLLVARRLPWPLTASLFARTDATAVVGIFLTAIGLGFAVWARVVLAGNWSAEVTVKRDHELIQSGPYALARHPIYTGLSLAFLAAFVAIGEWRALIAAVIAIASFVYKLSIEERLMRETFGQAYDVYAERVKALVPFII